MGLYIVTPVLGGYFIFLVLVWVESSCAKYRIRALGYSDTWNQCRLEEIDRRAMDLRKAGVVIGVCVSLLIFAGHVLFPSS